MHCTSSYPTPLDQADLNTLPAMIQRHHTPVGLSDHTQGIAAPIAAVALGATMVEKHLTLGRADGSVDAAFSLEPAEFRAMAVACREAWSALGQVRQGLEQLQRAQQRLDSSEAFITWRPAHRHDRDTGGGQRDQHRCENPAVQLAPIPGTGIAGDHREPMGAGPSIAAAAGSLRGGARGLQRSDQPRAPGIQPDRNHGRGAL